MIEFDSQQSTRCFTLNTLMRNIFTFILLICSPRCFSEAIEAIDVNVDYQPQLKISYLSSEEHKAFELIPELIIRLDWVETVENTMRGYLNVSVVANGNINVVNMTSLADIPEVENLFRHQLEDIEIILRNRFGSFLTRLREQKFEDPQALVNVILDNWGNHWKQSQELWQHHYKILEMGIEPTIQSQYVARYRKHFLVSNPFQATEPSRQENESSDFESESGSYNVESKDRVFEPQRFKVKAYRRG